MKKLDWEMITEQKVGPDLDKLIAETVMDQKPKKRLIVSNDSGESYTISDDDLPGRSIYDWLTYKHSQDLYSDYEVVELEVYEPYSTYLLSAMDVAAKLRNDGWLVVIKMMPEGHHFIIEGSRSEYDYPHPDRPAWEGKTVVELTYMKQYDKNFPRMVHNQFANGDTIMEAVCLAALKAKLILQELGMEENETESDS